jgi:hypothetical protein
MVLHVSATEDGQVDRGPCSHPAMHRQDRGVAPNPPEIAVSEVVKT